MAGVDAETQPAVSSGTQSPSYAPAFLCPPEILGDIFEWSLDRPTHIFIPSNQKFNFLFVCRLWNQVAVDTAKLWTFLDGNVRSWPTLLVRSKSAPLHIHIFQLRDVPSPYLVTESTLRQRLETLHIVESPSTLSALPKLLFPGDDTSITPRLISVKLVAVASPTRSVRVMGWANIPSSFSSQRFPMLRELELHDCHCDYQAGMFHSSTLKRLSITSLGAITSPSMDDLLSILDDNRDLEYLRISPRALEEDLQKRIPLLPFLRTLVVEGDAFRIENFLLVFSVPKDLERATLRFDPLDPAFLATVEPSLAILHRGIVARKLRLDSRQASLALDAYSDLDNKKPYLSLNFQQSIYGRPPRIELHTAGVLVPRDGVTTLEIRGDHHPPDECAALLSRLSAVNRLRVFEDCALSVVRVLRPNEAAAQAMGTLLLPGLTQLWLDDVDFSTVVENQSFFEELSGCISRRRQAGAKLENLTLCGSKVRPEDLAELREVVEVDVRDGDIRIAPEDPIFVISAE